MKKLTLCLAFLVGCSGGREARLHVQENAKWHHQVVFHDSVVADGYTFGVFRRQSEDYVVMAIGRPFVCGDGDKLVLDQELSVVSANGDSKVSVGKLANFDFGVVGSFAEKKRIESEFDRIKVRLPMLFSSAGCQPENSDQGTKF